MCGSERLSSHLRPCDDLHFLNDLSLLVWGEQVGDIPRVQDHVDVLHKSLILDLVIREEEDSLLSFGPSLQQ